MKGRGYCLSFLFTFLLATFWVAFTQNAWCFFRGFGPHYDSDNPSWRHFDEKYYEKLQKLQEEALKRDQREKLRREVYRPWENVAQQAQTLESKQKNLETQIQKLTSAATLCAKLGGKYKNGKCYLNGGNTGGSGDDLIATATRATFAGMQISYSNIYSRKEGSWVVYHEYTLSSIIKNQKVIGYDGLRKKVGKKYIFSSNVKEFPFLKWVVFSNGNIDIYYGNDSYDCSKRGTINIFKSQKQKVGNLAYFVPNPRAGIATLYMFKIGTVTITYSK